VIRATLAKLVGTWAGRAITAALIAGSLATAWWQYRSGLIEMGRAECQAKVQRAIDQQQRIADENAALYETGRVERQVEYRYRTREVVKHVESDSDCDWSPGAFRLLNNAITGAEPAGEPGRAVPGPPDYRITHATGDRPLDRLGSRDVPGLQGAPPGDR